MRAARLVAFVWAAAPVALAGVRPAYGGDLRVALPGLPQALDPATAVSTADLVVLRATCDPLVRLGADGSIAPVLLAKPPDSVEGGFRLDLRPGVRAHRGSIVDAGAVVAALERLSDPSLGSPYAALLLPVASLKAQGETGVDVRLAFPYPDWPRGLAHPAACVRDTGPFQNAGSAPSGPLFSAFDDAGSGRPYADHLRILTADARAAARALALHTADAAVSAVPGASSVEGPMMQTTFLSLNPDRLGPAYAAIRTAIEGSVDPGDLVRYFVRSPAAPLRSLLPPPLDVGPAAAGPAAGGPRPAQTVRVTLFVDASNADHRSVAERIQVLLHDQGIQIVVRSVPRAEFGRLIQRRDYELAVVGISALPEAGLALAQVVLLASGRDAAIAELSAIGRLADAPSRRSQAAARARELRATIPLVPLYACGARLALGEGVYGATVDATGVPSLADLWKWGAR